MEYGGMTRRGFLQSATIASAATLTAGAPRTSGRLLHAQTSAAQAQVGQPTTLFHFTVREDMQQEAQELLPRMAAASREEPGCVAYVIYQETNNPRQFVLLEQWRDRAALSAHFENLREVFGPPTPGSRSPLPAVFMDLAENMRGDGYLLFA